MQADLSRVTFDRRKHYSGVLAQQGRVQLDADLNEQLAIRRNREVTSLTDVIGACGAPKYAAGFAITPAPGAGDPDLVILPGRYYVHGETCELEGSSVAATAATATGVTVALWRPDDLAFAPGQFVEVSATGVAAAVFRVTAADEATLELTLDPGLGAFVFASEIRVRRLSSYLTQPDLPDATSLLGLPDGSYIVYLDVWQRHVSTLVDGSIRETALGGPDTATRAKTVWQVRIWPPPGPNAQALPGDVTCATPIEGFDEATADPTGRLSARTKPGEEPGPCTVPPGAGYLGLENQLYRIEVHQGGTLGTDEVTFKWSRDNASVAKAIEKIAGTTDHTVADADPDDVLGLASGQWVEQVDDAVDLDPLARDLFQFSKDPVTGVVTLLHPVDEDRHPYLRRWDGDGEIVVPSPPVGDGWLDLENGIQVHFEPGTYRTGDYWLVPARTALGDIEWPRDENGDPIPEPARGIRHLSCRIAVLHVEGGVITVEDCRPIIPPLVELKACATCCTLTVSNAPGQPGDFTTIQDAVDHLPVGGGEICVLAGTYVENVVVTGKSRVRIKGCCDRTHVVSAAPVDNATAAPVVRIVDSTEIVLEHLGIEAHETGIGVLVDLGDGPCRGIVLEELDVTASKRSAIEVLGAEDVVIERCEVAMKDTNGGWAGIFLQAMDAAIRRCRVTGTLGALSIQQALTLKGSLAVSAIQIAGGSERVVVEDNVLEGCSGQGVTLGSVEIIDANGNPTGDPVGWPSGGDDPCVDCGTVTSGDDPGTPGGGTNGGTTVLVSAGDLYDVAILRNRIEGMGLDGIGVVHFFDLAQSAKGAGIVRVERLEITGNRIERCVRRAFGVIADRMADLMAYGGISLAFVEGLIVRDNQIEDIGVGGFLPVCGIFVLYGEGVEIARNVVLNAGLAGRTPGDAALRGRRGGIHVLYAAVLVSAAKGTIQTGTTDFGLTTGLAATGSQFLSARRADFAAAIEENTVDVNRGQALVVGAIGPVGVISNRLISRGLVSLDLLGSVRGAGAAGVFNVLSYLSSLVAIIDFGLSGAPAVAPSYGNATNTVTTTDVAVLAKPPRRASGNVLYADNQSHLDLGAGELARGPALPNEALLPAILILGMDDVGFHDNQCDADVEEGRFLIANFIVGLITVRATSNRWKETLGRAFYSAITAGLMDVTVDNQANHCIGAVGPLRLTNAPNHELVSVFVQTFCAGAEGNLAAAFR